MSSVHPVTDPNTWGPAIDEAVNAVSRGGLIVLPTDTVYGIGADAFDAAGRRGPARREGPRPADAPARPGPGHTAPSTASRPTCPADARALVETFWPGGFTIILPAQPSLAWDLGETHGTVALRMPDHPAALALLRRTGPLAVSSANATGRPAALDVTAAQDSSASRSRSTSTAATHRGEWPRPSSTRPGRTLRVVREGAVSLERMREIAPVLALGEEPQEPDDAASDDAASDVAVGDAPSGPGNVPAPAADAVPAATTSDPEANDG